MDGFPGIDGAPGLPGGPTGGVPGQPGRPGGQGLSGSPGEVADRTTLLMPPYQASVQVLNNLEMFNSCVGPSEDPIYIYPFIHLRRSSCA